jgi:hypothetical protein
MSMKPVLLATLCTLPLLSFDAAAARHWEKSCSVKMEKGASAEEMKAKATLSRDDAEVVARANMTRRPGPLREGVLAVESGCLVWELNYKRGDNKPGHLKLLIDAGAGQFLVEKAEAPSKEDMEKTRKK